MFDKPLFDSHCHIQFQGFKDDRESVLIRCAEKNVVMNVVGTQKDTSKKAVEFAEKYKNIYATIGLHPIHLFPTRVDEEESSFVSREEDFKEEYYSELVKSEKVIAIGECGIDLYHIPKDKNKAEVLERQRKVFLQQVAFANRYDLPLVIHVRDAHDELLDILKSNPPIGGRSSKSGVVHCYTSNWTNARRYLDFGFYLGFTGVVTFPPKKTDPQPQEDLLEVIKKCPLDRMLVETDAPYLAPQAYRGERCEPWMVEEVVKKIAEVKQADIAQVLRQINKNTQALFTKIYLKLN